VERAGQGLNDIFENTIREGKGVPNFQGSDAYSVVLRIPAQVKTRILFFSWKKWLRRNKSCSLLRRY